MPIDPGRLLAFGKYISGRVASVIVAVFVALITASIFLYNAYGTGPALIPLLLLFALAIWLHGVVAMQIMQEHDAKLEKLKPERATTAIHLLFAWQAAQQRNGKVVTPDMLDHPQVVSVLNELDSLCKHDGWQCFGWVDFRSKYWHILCAYWYFAHPLIIDKQRKNPEIWKHIFPTFSKYRCKFGDEYDKQDDPLDLLRKERDLCEKQP